ncbi:inositol monophosphatase family protein [Halarcobacter sp.]|uniref:inositol monophosphatase family protein n=1 Tax=Halarcobacter sp. TaxID=2321133 RepID=UPI002AABF8B2|nr:inositol monophosphatase family protein [Halarcobacter sp.]
MLEILKNIVLEAGELFKEGYYNNKKIEFKGAKDLVTNYDVAVENLLIEKLTQSFEGFDVIAEESKNNYETFYNSIIIDPIDGTTNFVNKVPHCAISVGIYKNKKPYLAVVYNPILDELYSAQVDKGAYCNGKRIKVSQEEDLQLSLIATGFPYTSVENKEDLDFVLKALEKILPKCQDIRRLGSASLDICMVAKGVFDAYYEINTNPWDVAAGIIILKEAGGCILNSLGEEYNMFEDKCIVATNGKIDSLLYKELKDI